MNRLMIVAVICAYIVKGMCGFANTLVFSSILGFTNNNIDISPVELIVGYPANIVMAFKERKAISLRVGLPLSLMVIGGCIPGTFFLKLGNIWLIKLLFGFVVVGIGVEMLLRQRSQKQNSKGNRIVLALIGIISGILCGLFGVGALLAAYVSRTTDSTSSFRGNLSIVFIVENTFRLILYTATGIINKQILVTGITLLPYMMIGLVVGMMLTYILSEEKVKKAVTIMLILSGCSLIISNLLAS